MIYWLHFIEADVPVWGEMFMHDVFIKGRNIDVECIVNDVKNNISNEVYNNFSWEEKINKALKDLSKKHRFKIIENITIEEVEI